MISCLGKITTAISPGDYVTLGESGLLVCNVPAGEWLNGVCRLSNLGRHSPYRFRLFGEEVIVLVHESLANGNLENRMLVAIKRFMKLRDMIHYIPSEQTSNGISDDRQVEL